MEGLNDAYTSALSNKGGLISTATLEHSMDCISRIRQFMVDSIGKYAILYKYDGNKLLTPQLVEIVSVNNHIITVRYKCYDSEGSFRCYLSNGLTPADIYCRSVRLELFQDI